MTPTLHQNAGVFLLDWPEDKVTIRIDRIRCHSDNVTGEMCIKANLPGINGHLHLAREQLLSTTTRRTLAKHLEERVPDLDWRAILEEACVLTVTAYRQAEPVVELHDAPLRSGPRWRIEPLLIDKHPNLFYGDGAVGKSVFALFLAALVSSGYHVCGLNPLPGAVLFLDYETSAEEVRERLEMIEAGLGENKCSQIHYRFCCQPLTDEIEEIQAIVAEKGVDLVIVDSMGVALGGEKGDPRVPTVEYFRALRSLRCCTLTIDHVTKGPEAKANPYGSIYKRNLTRNMFEMRKQQEPGEDVLKIGLYHRKANFGSLMRPLGFRLSFQNDALYVAQTDVRDVPELAEGMSARERIRAALRSHAMSIEEVSMETGVPVTQVRARMTELHKAGIVANDGGRWGLLTGQEE